MASRIDWTDEHDTAIRDGYAAGTPIRQIATNLGISVGSVSQRARKIGATSTARTIVAAAAEANRLDAAARRAALAVDLLGDVERLRTQLWLPHTYFDWGGKDHDFAEHTTPEPTPTDKLKLAQASSTLIGSIERLTKLDADAGVHEAVGMLDGIAAAIKAAADQVGDQEPA